MRELKINVSWENMQKYTPNVTSGNAGSLNRDSPV